ncbi:hypothetical protein GYD82_003756 [Salmonella enterica]|nr:hypothetical protein [Salmonella enterica]
MKTDTDGLTMNQLAERNAGHVATVAALEARCAALSAKLSMINDLMEAAEQANKLAQEATEKLVQERNALAAENAGLNKFIAASCFVQAGEELAWYPAIDHAPETPATDDFLAEVRAQSADELAELYFTLAAHEANRYIADSWRESARFAKDHAAQLRQKAAQ